MNQRMIRLPIHHINLPHNFSAVNQNCNIIWDQKRSYGDLHRVNLNQVSLRHINNISKRIQFGTLAC